MPDRYSTQSRGLLRLLLLWHCSVPAQTSRLPSLKPGGTPIPEDCPITAAAFAHWLGGDHIAAHASMGPAAGTQNPRRCHRARAIGLGCGDAIAGRARRRCCGDHHGPNPRHADAQSADASARPQRRFAPRLPLHPRASGGSLRRRAAGSAQRTSSCGARVPVPVAAGSPGNLPLPPSHRLIST